MDEFNIELRKVVDISIDSDVDIDNVSSLRELFEAKKKKLALSERQICRMLELDQKTMKAILEGKLERVDFVNIIKLSHFLGLSISDMAKVYIPDMDPRRIGEIQRAREAGYITENFDVASLVKIKFFHAGMTGREMSERIRKFFNIDSLYDYSNMFPTAFSRTKKSSDERMRKFWVWSAMCHFKGIDNKNRYDRNALIDLVPRIKPFTRDVSNGLIRVMRALYNAGVTVIYQPSVGKAQVRGATMSVNGKPCIVISGLNNRYPTLWFALLHELYHVLFDFEDISTRTYHISDNNGDLFLVNEESADSFASAYLLNESRLKFISRYMASPYYVARIASEWNIHPSIVYAMYCHDNPKEWALYSKFIPTMDEAVKFVNTHPFECGELAESVRKIKELIYID